MTTHNLPTHPSRSSNTMLGNTWHLPTAIWMLFLLLTSAQGTPIHPGVQYTNLQKMTVLWNQSPVPWGPPPQAPVHHYMPQMAKQHHQNSQHPAPLDPTLHWAIQQQVQIPNINEVRHNISEELQQLVSEWTDTTAEWFHTLPTHCQKAYRQPTMITQIPLLHYLLQTIQYPHADILFRELTDGFPLIGHLQPGLNWKVRTDTKYTEHQSLSELHSYNRDYVLKKLHQHRVDDHWQMMADEIAKEVQMGRMDGPFAAPTWWDRPAVALRTHERTKQLKPLPHPTPYTRQVRMVIPTYAEEKTGEGVDTTAPATWQTNHTTTHQTTTSGWHSTPTSATHLHYKCGDTISNYNYKIPAWHMSCCSHLMGRPYGYIMSSFLGALPVYGPTTGLATCSHPLPES